MNDTKETAAELTDILDIAQTVPVLPDDLIDRSACISTISNLFAGGADVVMVEGISGLGKSVLLRQFAEYQRTKTITLFLSAGNAFSLDANFIRYDLLNQITWELNTAQLTEEADIDPRQVTQGFLRLARRANSKRQTYYIVVDGLTDLSEEGSYVSEIIFQSLPFGMRHFKILLTGSESILPPRLLPPSGVKIYSLDPFSLHDTERYLADFALPTDLLKDIWRTTDGNPAKLASLKRLLGSGQEPEAIIDRAASSLDGFYELEWSAIQDNVPVLEALATIAFDDRPWVISELADIFPSDQQQSIETLPALPFVTESSTKHLSFVTTSYKEFAKKRLAPYKNSALSRIIDHLQSKSDDEDAVVALPIYLSKAGRIDDLLSYTSNDYLEIILRKTKTIAAIQRTLELGFDAAERERKHEALTKLALDRSLLSELWRVEPWQAEIQANLALGNIEDALLLADGARLKEDQLQLLAIIASHQLRGGSEPEVVTLDRISELLTTIEPDHIGLQKTYSIAGDLFPLMPERAIELVRNASTAEESEDTLEWMLASLTVSAIQYRGGKAQAKDSLDILRSKLTDHKAKRIVTFASAFLDPSGVENILREVSQLDKPGDKIYLLRQWIVENPTTVNVERAIQFCLTTAISASEYSTTAAFYRDITAGLRGVNNFVSLTELIRDLDGQKSLALKKGPTKDYVRFQLHVANAEARVDSAASDNRLLELYLDVIESIDDPSVKAICLAWTIRELIRYPNRKTLNEKEELLTQVKLDLEAAVDTILRTTAEHYEILSPLCEPLAIACPDYALSLAKKLNTPKRRDEMLRDVVAKIAGNEDVTDETLTEAMNQLAGLDHPDARDDAVVEVLLEIETNPRKEFLAETLWAQMRRTVDLVSASTRKTQALVSLLKLGAAFVTEAQREELLNRLESEWTNVDGEWHKIEIAFKIAKGLGSVDKEAAAAYMARAHEIQRTAIFPSSDSHDAIRYVAILAIQAFQGLLRSGIATGGDLLELKRLIGLTADGPEYVARWGNVACIYFSAGDAKRGKELVEEEILPILMKAKKQSLAKWRLMVEQCASALWYTDRDLCREAVLELPRASKDQACYRVVEFISTRIIPPFPCGSRKEKKLRLTYSELREILSVCDLMSEDSLIYRGVRIVTDATLHTKTLTEEQKQDIAGRMSELIKRKLPSVGYISHPGFLIASEAQVMKMQGEKRPKMWEMLIGRAREIDNVADLTMVLGMIAKAMPAKLKQLKLQTLDDGLKELEKLHSEQDRLNRENYLIEALSEVDVAKAKVRIRATLGRVNEEEGEYHRSEKRKMIDLAYRLDPDLPERLVTVLDDDPARMELRRQAQSELNVNELKKALSNEKEAIKWSREFEKELPNAAWRALANLNADASAPVHMDRARELFGYAKKYPIAHGFPIFAYVFENVIRTYSGTPASRDFIRSLWSAALGATELGANVLTQLSAADARVRLSHLQESRSESIMVGAGTDGDAEAFLEGWLEQVEGDEFTICDPYFGPGELEWIRLIGEVKPDAEILVIGSESYQRKEIAVGSYPDAYSRYWREHLSGCEFPYTRILLLRTASGKFPIHDRWILASQDGVRLGTSLNALTGKRMSEISILSKKQFLTVREGIWRFVNMSERYYEGERIGYQLFELT